MDNDPRIRCRKGDCFMRDLLFLSDNDGQRVQKILRILSDNVGQNIRKSLRTKT